MAMYNFVSLRGGTFTLPVDSNIISRSMHKMNDGIIGYLTNRNRISFAYVRFMNDYVWCCKIEI